MIPTTLVGRLVAVAYLVTVAGLTARAFSDSSQEHWGAEIAAAVLTLPTIVAALPAIYMIGAAAWSIGPMWPVTLTFTLMMTGVACANVALLTATWRSLRGSASASARTRSGA